MDSVFKFIAVLGVIGYLPVAPGTFGTLVGLCTIVILKPSPVLLGLILSVAVPLGAVSSHRAETLLGEKDSPCIVIDEFCGFLVSFLFIPLSAGTALAAFFLFRLFDILKPFPIRTLESSLRGGLGVMADDIMAGVYTNIILHSVLAWNPHFFSVSP